MKVKMKNFVYFIILFFLLNEKAHAEEGTFAVASYGMPRCGIGEKLSLIGGAFAFIALFIAFIKIIKHFKTTKFNYETEYTRFKVGDKVKITFVTASGKVITKRCRIKEIDANKVILDHNKDLYECVARDIKNIQKYNNLLLTLILLSILFLLMGFAAKVVMYYLYD